jgi:2-hydroxychromene-2-carboxylate isomerase
MRPRPVVFAAILDANGQKGPAEIGAKRVFTYRFVVWQAKALGIPLKFPHAHPFNPIALLRLAIACDCRLDAITRIFRFVWRDGRLPDLPIEWAELADQLGVDNADARIADPAVKAALRGETDAAIARGVFGVPTIVVGSELFWGVDATDMALDYMRAGGRYADPEYARVAELPSAAVRQAARPTTKRA